MLLHDDVVKPQQKCRVYYVVSMSEVLIPHFVAWLLFEREKLLALTLFLLLYIYEIFA